MAVATVASLSRDAMARIYQACEFTIGGGTRWKYAVRPSALATPVPVGYCARQCAGHATADEAADHWDRWQADESQLREERQGWRQCVVCGVFTVLVRTYDLGFVEVPLCASHDTPEYLYGFLRTRRAGRRRPARA